MNAPIVCSKRLACMVLVATGFILSLNASNAQEPFSDPRSARILAMTKVYEPREYVSTSKVSLRYRMLKPMGYQPGKKYPLVLFLHGAGERGDDNQVTLVHAASDFADEQRRKQYPCYVVIPQCPERKKWSEVDWSKDSSELPKEPSTEPGMRLHDIQISSRLQHRCVAGATQQLSKHLRSYPFGVSMAQTIRLSK